MGHSKKGRHIGAAWRGAQQWRANLGYSQCAGTYEGRPAPGPLQHSRGIRAWRADVGDVTEPSNEKSALPAKGGR